MKKFYAKVIVKIKPGLHDARSENLKHAIQDFIPLHDLSCQAGNVFYLDFSAHDQCEALHIVEKIASNLLSNELIEDYEIRKIEEI